jgi:nicotinamidase-related amidase
VTTALIVIDPYNDFTSRRGKGRPLVRKVATEVGLIRHLHQAIDAARRSGIPVVYAPHHRYRRGFQDPIRYPNPSQYLSRLTHFFADGRYGGRFRAELAPAPGDFVAIEHHVSSGFAGTDLDAHLRSIGVTDLMVCGLLTNTCVESTVRQAVDLDYRVTVLADAVAAWSPEDHRAALDGSFLKVAHRVIATEKFISTTVGR